MNYSTIVKDGSGRDEVLKRRNAVVRQTPGMTSPPKREVDLPADEKAEEKPSA